MTSPTTAQVATGRSETVADESAISDGSTRLAYILGVPLAEDVVREWPQMGEIVRGRELIGAIEGNFEELTLAVGERRRNVTIAQIEDGEAVRVTDYWGKPFEIPEWRKATTDRLDMPPSGRWPSADRLSHH